MKFAFFNDDGRVHQAVNDLTVSAKPIDAIELTEEQWNHRFDLLLAEGELTIDPLTPPVIPVETRFTPLEFLEKFTDVEQLAVVEATMTIPSVKLWYDKMLAASYVDINDPRTEGGLSALVSAGLLTDIRMEEIIQVS